MAYRESRIFAGILGEMIWSGRMRDLGKGRIAGQSALVFKEMLLSMTAWVLVPVLRFVPFGLGVR